MEAQRNKIGCIVKFCEKDVKIDINSIGTQNEIEVNHSLLRVHISGKRIFFFLKIAFKIKLLWNFYN